jgi:hypothetical protein
MAPLLNRRTALFAGLAAAWAVPAVAAAQGTVTAWTPKALSAEEARTLAAACERIMPATDTPGAGAAGVPQFIDRAMFDWALPADAARLKAGLAAIDAEARSRFGAGFASLPAAQQDQVLTAVQAQPYFMQLRSLVTDGYFTSQIGATRALRYDPVPGAYKGCIPFKEIGRGWATS